MAEYHSEWMVLLAGRDKIPAKEGQGLELRMLSAREALEARREAGSMAAGPDAPERALCSNACLLARALLRDGTPPFQSGSQVLECLSVEQIASLARQWADFSRLENPGLYDNERTQQLKKASSTRQTPASSGACSGPSTPSPQRSGPRP